MADDLARNGEPQAAPLGLLRERVADLAEFLENDLLVGCTDADAVVEDSSVSLHGMPILATDHVGEIVAPGRVFGGSIPTVMRHRSSSEVWSSKSLPGGIANFSCVSVIVYEGATYLFGHTNDGADKGVVLKWLNGALTTVNGPLGSNTLITGAVAYGGYIYYVHGTHTTGGTFKVGRFDGTTFTDAYKDLATQFAATNPPEIRNATGPIAVVRHGLRILANRNGLTTVGLYSPTLVDASGAWELTASFEFEIGHNNAQSGSLHSGFLEF